MSVPKQLFENPAAGWPMGRASESSPGAMLGQSLATDLQSFIAYARSYPFTLPGAQAKFGINVFDMMENEDACVQSCLRKLKQEVLSKPPTVTIPNVKDHTAKEIKAIDFVYRAIENMTVPVREVAWQMLDHVKQGHTLAEATWADGEGADLGRDTLADVRVIPANMYTIVLDAYGRFLGVIGRQPGRVPLIWTGPILMDLWSIPGFVPYWKLILLSHNPKPGDLRGTTRFDPAYNPFRLKKENWANWFDYLRNFAKPKTLVSLGPNAVSPDPLLTAEQYWTEKIGEGEYDILAIPKDSNVAYQQFPNGWQPYVEVLNTCNKEIATAIIGQSRAVNEAEHGSKADTESAQQGVDEDTDYIGQQLWTAFTLMAVRPLVRKNFGKAIRLPWVIRPEDVEDSSKIRASISNMAKAGLIKAPTTYYQALSKTGFDEPTREEKALIEEQFKTAGTLEVQERVNVDENGDPQEQEKAA